MRIHHLNCGSFCPHGARLVNGEGGLLERALIVCHCLLIEAGAGLVLVDTGLGLEDARNPRQLGRVFGALMKPRPTEETTAVRQVEALGFEPGDVRHIVTTHLDLDHAGGLPDFPAAEVHLLGTELKAAETPVPSDRMRYIGGAHWRHKPRWVPHTGSGGDQWFGFESVRILPDVDAEILLVPLAGHSRGHTGVAVRTDAGWLLHCGDAYFHGGEVAIPPSCPPMLRLFQNLTAVDNKVRKANQERLRELNRAHGDEVKLFCAHDPRELDLLRAAEAAAATAG
ncbi:MAG TPA: MBL fold metallo-hydrolase [Solirubrobacterales bacterium]|nr:MBL fold metallo-hydrolase [Solirubrobacterales bacterium]